MALRLSVIGTQTCLDPLPLLEQVPRSPTRATRRTPWRTLWGSRRRRPLTPPSDCRQDSAAPMTACQGCRTIYVAVALQQPPNRGAGARRLRGSPSRLRPSSLIWVMRITQPCISAAGRAAVFMRNPTLSRKCVPDGHWGILDSQGAHRANRQTVVSGCAPKGHAFHGRTSFPNRR